MVKMYFDILQWIICSQSPKGKSIMTFHKGQLNGYFYGYSSETKW